MAKQTTDVAAQCRKLVEDAKNGVFSPVYLLMGDEPYYPDLVCQAIIDNCIPEEGKDFNETVCYGSDVTADQVISAARRYPMMADRQLIVLKEAQSMKTLDSLSIYCEDPLESTVLVVLMHKATADKRRAFYKSAVKNGVVVDSPAIREYNIASWIENYYSGRGLRIEPQAAALLGESVGTDLSTIVAETDKLVKNLPEGTGSVTVADIERNVGISRQFSALELARELTFRNSAKALRIAAHMGQSARFVMPVAVGALYMQFYRILKYEALLQRKPDADQSERIAVLGVSPYFLREYDTAVRNYPLPKTMAVMSLLCEYDYLGKGGDGANAGQDQLIVELAARILNV